MADSNPFAFGHLIEGRLEQDPMTDEYLIRSIDGQGKPVTIRLNAILESLKGQDVRLTLASFENLARLATMVEEAGTGQVMGVSMNEVPGANIVRKSG